MSRGHVKFFIFLSRAGMTIQRGDVKVFLHLGSVGGGRGTEEV